MGYTSERAAWHRMLAAAEADSSIDERPRLGSSVLDARNPRSRGNVCPGSMPLALSR